jgi:hypothetical protein
MTGGSGEVAVLAGRAAHGAIGLIAGLAAWYFIEDLPGSLENPQAYLAVGAFLGAYFAGLMALTGPLRLRTALPVAAITALPAALLLGWASLRYDTLAEMFTRPEPVLAYLVLVSLPLPYLIAGFRPGAHWRDYDTLFSESWGIVLRLASAGLFTGIAWLAVFLSNELLRLVGIDVIERLIDKTWLTAAFSGLVAGLALAIVNERSARATPGLVLTLLRLMIVPALIVVGAFTIAIPVRGIEVLFGALSPAATLMAIALVLALLVSTGVGAAGTRPPPSVLVRLAARGLAFLLPVIAALALWALWRRYEVEGLSPARLAAFLAGALLLAYGLGYALAALTPGWMARVRAVNGWLALVVIALAALWLTPVLDAERLSATDQVARLKAGAIDAEALDIWTLEHDWGRAGRAAVAALEAEAAADPEGAELARRIAFARQAPDRGAFGDVGGSAAPSGGRAELKRLMPVQPPEAEAEFDRYVLPWYAGSVASFLDGCHDLTAGGRPGCVLVVHDLVPANPGREAILFYKSFGLLRGEVIVPEPVFRRADAAEVFSIPAPDFAETDALIERLQDGGFEAGPAQINAITIGERQFTVPF